MYSVSTNEVLAEIVTYLRIVSCDVFVVFMLTFLKYYKEETRFDWNL